MTFRINKWIVTLCTNYVYKEFKFDFQLFIYVWIRCNIQIENRWDSGDFASILFSV